MKKNKMNFFWPYNFFYYTLLMHFRKEDGVKDIAPLMAVIGLSFWWSLFFIDYSIYLVSNCMECSGINIFSDAYNWFNRVFIFIIIFIVNFFYFFLNGKGKEIEHQYFYLSDKEKRIGNFISMFALSLGVALFLLVGFLAINSDYAKGLC